MAQKPIREAQAKKLIQDNWTEHQPGRPEITFAKVDPNSNLALLPHEHPWLNEGKLVAKVDELFGKRGKLGYVKIAQSYEEAKNWIEEFRGREVMVGERIGTLNHFLIEPFIEHTTEYYLAFTCEREHDIVHFSDKGGVEVEEQGNSIQAIRIKLSENLSPDPNPTTDNRLSGSGSEHSIFPIPYSLFPTVQGLFTLFRTLDLPSLEFNPITEVNGKVYLLDTVARVDTAAKFRQHKSWGSMEIPEGFGTTLMPEEKRIREMDDLSGSSLKFVLLNPNGRIWTMVAGGGASIIYADAITAQTDPKELANYGEWSGNPGADEMEAYTSEILSLIEKNTEDQVLIIGGGIANFTDIKRTFAGVIKALRKHQEKLKHLKIFVRRAGPNDKEGLRALKAACDEMKIPCVAYGAELPMTEIVEMAVDELGLRTNPKSLPVPARPAGGRQAGEIRNKSENRNPNALHNVVSSFVLFSFGFVSDFVLRISDFIT